MSYNIGFIGGGNMSTAIFKGILLNNGHPSSKIWVSGPNLDHLVHWSELGANITNRNGEVFAKCEYVFLGVKPGLLEKAVKDTVGTLPDGVHCDNVLVMSMLAGVTIERLQKVFRATEIYNSAKIVRIMPNTPVAVGSGACLYTYGDTVSDDQRVNMTKILKSCGACEEVPEAMMDSLGVLTGCGPAYVFVMIEALADGAVKQGVPRALALKFAAQVVKGSAHLVLETGKHPGQLKDEVCSPGGSTICGVSVLEDGKIRSTLINAIEASANRTKKLDTK